MRHLNKLLETRARFRAWAKSAGVDVDRIVRDNNFDELHILSSPDDGKNLPEHDTDSTFPMRLAYERDEQGGVA